MDAVRWGLLLAAGWIGLQLIQAVMVLAHILRVPFWPARTDDLDPLPALADDEQAAVEELRALGFEHISQWLVETGPHRFTTMLFQHRDSPTFATLNLLAAGNAAYPVAFWSFLPDGSLLETLNRLAWILPGDPPGVVTADAYADSLAGQLNFHDRRLVAPAAVRLSGEEAALELRQCLERAFESLCERGFYVERSGRWHLRLGAAARATATWMRVRTALARRYESPVTSERHQSSFYARCFEIQEVMSANLPERQNVKATMLVLSMLTTLVLWGVAESWTDAFALVGIILLHESGHAAAMIAFGYRDLSLFFVPFVGAFVTGRPNQISAWEQAVMLLAGPLPGIALGFVVLWLDSDHRVIERTAVMAIAINFFNLLPLTPLDGGRLLELSLFSRWPRLRVVFGAMSVIGIAALGLVLQSTLAGLFAIALAIGLRSQWRLAHLHAAWREGAERSAQAAHLFEVARRRFPPQSFLHQYALVRSIFAQREVLRPRMGESVLILGALVGVWGGAAAVVLDRLPATFSVRPHTEAQRAFDEAYSDYYEEETEASVETMKVRAHALEPDDPRHIDVRVIAAEYGPEAEESERLAEVLRDARDGYLYDLDSIEYRYFHAARKSLLDLDADARVAGLEAALARFDEIRPGRQSATIMTRIWLAEAVDQAGRSAEAEAQLEALARIDPGGCTECDLTRIRTARAWFLMSSGRAAEAVGILEQTPCVREPGDSRCEEAIDFAWALLLAGRTEEAAAHMRRGASGTAREPGFPGWLKGERALPGRIIRSIDLAHALRVNGRPDEARALFADNDKLGCEDGRSTVAWFGTNGPWQAKRQVATRETADWVCASQSGAVVR